MSNQYATPDQLYALNAIEEAVKATKTPLTFQTRDLYVYEKNTLLNRVNTLKGLRENNPIASKKHNDHVFELLEKNFFERETMRRGI